MKAGDIVYIADRDFEREGYCVYETEFVRQNHSWYTYRNPTTGEEFKEQTEWTSDVGRAWHNALIRQLDLMSDIADVWHNREYLSDKSRFKGLKLADRLLSAGKHLIRIKHEVEKRQAKEAQAVAEQATSEFTWSI